MRFFIDMYFLYLKRYENWLDVKKYRACVVVYSVMFVLAVFFITFMNMPNIIITYVLLCNVILQLIFLPFIITTLKKSK
jgi:hypothetical protein